MIEAEIAFFDMVLSELLLQHEGKFVLVKDQTLHGIFNTTREALSEGARRFGLSGFVARVIAAEQPIVRAPALDLGLLRGDIA